LHNGCRPPSHQEDGKNLGDGRLSGFPSQLLRITLFDSESLKFAVTVRLHNDRMCEKRGRQERRLKSWLSPLFSIMVDGAWRGAERRWVPFRLKSAQGRSKFHEHSYSSSPCRGAGPAPASSQTRTDSFSLRIAEEFLSPVSPIPRRKH
jgi:hypothetical protein